MPEALMFISIHTKKSSLLKVFQLGTKILDRKNFAFLL